MVHFEDGKEAVTSTEPGDEVGSDESDDASVSSETTIPDKMWGSAADGFNLTDNDDASAEAEKGPTLALFQAKPSSSFTPN
jgi:hypothetical protein